MQATAAKREADSALGPPPDAGAFPLTSPRDAALTAALPAGTYTVQVNGADGGTGIALLEVYELP